MPGAARPRFDVLRSLPRMSWRPLNLYMLWRRSLGPVAHEVTFTRSDMTLFQQRWRSKRLVRGYHGDHIPENVFKRWFLPRRLPDVRQHRTEAGKKAEEQYLADKYSGREDRARMAVRKQEEAKRRLDVFIFRCCFAPSVYQARQMAIHRNVRINGILQTNANYRLSPGDMVSVDPDAMVILKQQASPSVPKSEGSSSSPPPSESLQSNTTTISPEADSSTPTQHKESPHPQQPFKFPSYASPFLFLPAYIEANFSTCSAIYVRHPTARPGYSEVPSPYDAGGEVMRFAWEWYAKNRPRERKGGLMSRWKNPQFTRK